MSGNNQTRWAWVEGFNFVAGLSSIVSLMIGLAQISINQNPQASTNINRNILFFTFSGVAIIYAFIIIFTIVQRHIIINKPQNKEISEWKKENNSNQIFIVIGTFLPISILFSFLVSSMLYELSNVDVIINTVMSGLLFGGLISILIATTSAFAGSKLGEITLNKQDARPPF